VADIPGLIEGAHGGKGLGDRFLKHIERSQILVFLIEAIRQDILKDYDTLVQELHLFGESLVQKKRLVALTKVDLLDIHEREALPSSLDDYRCYPVSSVTGEGLQELLINLFQIIFE
jgi:GTP-binding protein